MPMVSVMKKRILEGVDSLIEICDSDIKQNLEDICNVPDAVIKENIRRKRELERFKNLFSAGTDYSTVILAEVIDYIVGMEEC